MKSSFRTGIVVHPSRDCREVIQRVVDFAATASMTIVMREADRDRGVEGVEYVDVFTFGSTCDGLLSIGGDGTMLGALRTVAHRPVPVLGVNMGNLGFLTEVEPDSLDAALRRVIANEFTIEEHCALLVEHANAEMIAFNDVAISRIPGSGWVQARMSVNDRQYGYYRCDALIISTPTGSTAYNYAAGGPVISPAAKGMLVTPASPMNGIGRSVFLSSEEVLDLELMAEGGKPALELDGRVSVTLQPGTRMRISPRPAAGLVVRLDAARHSAKQRLKLSLLDLPLLPQELQELRQRELAERTRR